MAIDDASETAAIISRRQDLRYQDLTEELHAYERKLKDAKRHQEELEEELDSTREQGRTERRKLTEEIEGLEDEIGRAKEEAREQVKQELYDSLRFQTEEAIRARKQAEEDYAAAHAKWDLERTTLKAQMASVQAAALEAMERSNNPTRLTMAVREQVDARLKAARQDWEIEWDGERRRTMAELERLRKATSADEKKAAAKRALLQKMGKLPGEAPVQKTADQWAKDFENARIEWDTERQRLKLRIEQLEREASRGRDDIRNEAFRELTLQYEPKIAAGEDARLRLQAELNTATTELDEERRRLSARITHLEDAMFEAVAAARRQSEAEAREEFEPKIEDINRMRTRTERRLQDSVDELELELRRAKRQIRDLEEQLSDARRPAAGEVDEAEGDGDADSAADPETDSPSED